MDFTHVRAEVLLVKTCNGISSLLNRIVGLIEKSLLILCSNGCILSISTVTFIMCQDTGSYKIAIFILGNIVVRTFAHEKRSIYCLVP